MDECPICMNKLNNEQKCITNCSHYFCYDCLTSWLSINNKCPNCRVDIEKFKYKGEINRIFMINNTEEIENFNINLEEVRGMLQSAENHSNRIKKLLVYLKTMTGLSIFFFMGSLYLVVGCDEI